MGFFSNVLFLDPSLLMMHPELAQSMIEYRFNRIQGAEEKAQGYDAGYKGNVTAYVYFWVTEGRNDVPMGKCVYR